MYIEGEVPIEVLVWLDHSPEALLARELAAALPAARFSTCIFDRARLGLHGSSVEVEPKWGLRWSGLITGRIALASTAAPPRAVFKPYASEPPAQPLSLESCWFALDSDGRVACFDRDQLG